MTIRLMIWLVSLLFSNTAKDKDVTTKIVSVALLTSLLLGLALPAYEQWLI